MITQKRLQELLTYNPETGIFTWNIPKKCVKAGDIAGTQSDRYTKIGIDYKVYSNHRLAWLYVYGYMPNVIDHINGNKKDNRLCNLREASSKQNSQNSKKPSNNTSGIKGISFDKYHNKWRAELYANGKRVFIKYFNAFDDAITAIKEARIIHHGDFAREA